MADEKSVISKIQTVGEEAIGKIANTDAGRSALKRASELRERAGKTLTGLESFEKRLEAIEKRLAALERKGTTASKPRSTASKPSSGKPKSSG